MRPLTRREVSWLKKTSYTEGSFLAKEDLLHGGKFLREASYSTLHFFIFGKK